MMKAVRVHDWCDPSGLIIEEIKKPVPKDDEILIKVNAAGLNFPDILFIAGKYQIRPERPFTPGWELAGVVEGVGKDISRFKVGERVLACQRAVIEKGLGAFAEFAVTPQDAVAHIPSSMSDEEAAVFPLVYQTSYFGLVYRGNLKSGETVLVHSAAGGVGIAAVQIARALGAGKIIGTTGSDEKLDVIRANGADIAVNYNSEDFVEVVKTETEGRGADVIYDSVGGEITEQSTKCVAFEGRIIIVGFTSGNFSKFMSNHILIKNYSVVGLHWGYYAKKDPDRMGQGWRELVSLYEKGGLKPFIGGRYPMAEIADAMEYLAARKVSGKLVLHW